MLQEIKIVNLIGYQIAAILFAMDPADIGEDLRPNDYEAYAWELAACRNVAAVRELVEAYDFDESVVDVVSNFLFN